MKRKLLAILLSIIGAVSLFGACAKEEVIRFDSFGKNEYSTQKITGEIGEFSLLTPEYGANTVTVPTFSWEQATNAETYVLEVCSSQNFSQTEDAVYVRKAGVVTTQFTISAGLKNKDATYYWRVTAVNSTDERLCSQEIGEFYLAADVDEEIAFNIDYADEWVVHKEGSKATVSIDKSNFFGDGNNALRIAFNEEDTNQGIPASDGWMVITHQQETELYGVDAFFFNFYYSGQDAKVFIRVVDEDNEYWNAEVKIANNAKQTVIIRFDEFTLRTKGGTTIANQVFDYNFVKYVEFVYEQSFGDGVTYISDLKAISYEKYSDMFLSSVDFSILDESGFTTEGYVFAKQFAEDGRAVTLTYENTPNDLNEKGVGSYGYGLLKMPVNKLMLTGDALAMKVTYTGTANARLLCRIIEEDGDRWFFRMSLASLPEDGRIVVPYSAFTLSEANGDGARQFYFIKTLQLGVDNVYASGSVTFEDISVVTLVNEVQDLYNTSVGVNGLVDDFEDYGNATRLYYNWIVSSANKDEAMALDTNTYGKGNTNCVKFTYKSDMYPATYGIQLLGGVKGYSAISFYANDQSAKSTNALVNYLPQVSAVMIITLYDEDGEQFTSTIPALNRYWTKYTVPFTSFANIDEFSAVTAVDAEKVVAISFGLQYFYYMQNGVPNPQYTSNNPVYMDNIAFTTATASEVTPLTKMVSPSVESPNLAVWEDFEGLDNDSLFDNWSMNTALSYSALEITDDVLTGKCLRMNYQGNQSSVSYASTAMMASNVTAKGIRLKMKGDGLAIVYINIFVTDGSTTFKFRATLKNISTEWTEYVVGFDNFAIQESSQPRYLLSTDVKNITKITFGIVNYSNNNESAIYVDDICFDSSVKMTALERIKVGD